MKPEFNHLIVPVELAKGDEGTLFVNRRNVDVNAIFSGLNAFFSPPVMRNLNDDVHIAISRPAPQSAIESFNSRYGCLPSLPNLDAVGRKHFILPLEVYDDMHNQMAIVLFKTDTAWEAYVVVYHFDSLIISAYFSELKKKEKWGHNASTTDEYRAVRNGELAIGEKKKRIGDYILYQYEIVPVLIWTVLKGIEVARVISDTPNTESGNLRRI